MNLLTLLVRKVIGTVHYSPAEWMFFFTRPRFLKVILPLLIVVLSVTGYGYYWYLSLPQPNYVAVTVTNPPATLLEPNAKPISATISFSRSIFRPENFEKNIADKIKIDPPFQGSVIVAAADRLVVTPDKDWFVDTPYKINIAPQLLDKNAIFKEKTIEFKTPKLQIGIPSFVIEEDPIDPLKRTALATVQLSHLVDRSAFEKRIKLLLTTNEGVLGQRKEEELSPTVTYNDKGSVAFIRSPLLVIPTTDAKLSLEIDKGVTTILSGNPNEIPVSQYLVVPGAENYFKIKNIEVRSIDNPENFSAGRVITVATSSLVAPSELERHLEAYLLEKPTKKENNESIGDDAAPDSFDNAQYNDTDENASDETSEGSITQSVENSSLQNLENCPVSTAVKVTENELKKGTKLSLKRISADRPYVDFASFSFEAPKDRCIFVRFNAGAKSAAGVLLSKTVNTLHSVSAFPGAVDFLHKGSILNISGDKKLTFYGRNIESVKLELFRLLPHSIPHLVSQSYGSFSNPQFNYNFGPENISEVFSSTVTLPSAEDGKPRFSTFDFSQYIKQNNIPQGLFLLKLSSDYDHNGGYFPDVSRIILFTDLGFLVKTNSDRTRVVLTASLKNGTAQQGATVNLLGKNGEPIFTGVTDEQGRVDVPSVDQYKFEKEPLVWIVKNDNDVSFMPFSRRDRDVNLSRFDVGGIYSYEGSAKDLNAYLFTDRGIYRPGETAHLQSIIKRTDWQPLVDKFPLVLSVEDPRGKTLIQETFFATPEGLSSYDYAVSENAYTGVYHWTVALKGKTDTTVIGEGNFKVEEFEPDRIKIETSLASIDPTNTESILDLDSLLWITPQDIKTVISVKNLFGTPAADNFVSTSLQLKPSIPTVTGFPGYSFVNPYAEAKSFDEDLGEVTTNEKGEAKIDLNLSRFEKAIYRLVVVSEAKEKNSGKKVYSQLRTAVNPLPYLFGYKANGNLNFIRKDSDRSVHLIAINNKGQKDLTSNLTARVFRYDTISVLTKTQSGSYAYEAQEKKIPVQDNTVEISKDGLTVPLGGLDTGAYGYELYSSIGIKVLEFRFRVIGDSKSINRIPRVSEVKITLEKKDFKPNEDISVALQAPYPGSGFITIEKDKVYASSFFKCQSLDCVQHIAMPETLEGNGYITVTYVRSIDSDDIFTNPFSAATEPITVNREKRTLPVTISVPEKIKPGEQLSITASSSRRSKAIIYAVDEGILQVARYKKPDPFSLFYAKRALEVTTSQILDLLLPEYEIERRLSAAGGDDDAILGKVKNPFKRKGQKPVIFSSGIIDLTPESRTFNYTVPDYFNGSIKTYLVGVDEVSVGVKDVSTTVQGDLILQPSMPVIAAPRDSFPVSSLITNLRVKDSNIKLAYEHNSLLEKVSPEEVTGSVEEGHETVLSTLFRAGKDLGEGAVTVIAKNKSGATLAKYPLTISIRPPVSLQTIVDNKKIISGETKVTLNGSLYKEYAERLLKVSKTPTVFLEGLSLYLDSYPYGCSEQVLSQLAYRVVASQARHEVPNKYLNQAFSILASRTQSDGGLSLWEGTQSSFETTIHQAYVFSELERRHIILPHAQRESLVQYLENQVVLNPETLDDAKKSAQTLYFLTQFGSDTAQRVNAFKENMSADKKFAKWQNSSIGLYIAASFEALKMQQDADSIIKQVSLPTKSTFKSLSNNFFEDYLGELADYQLLLRRHFPATFNKSFEYFNQQIVSELLEKQFTTYSAARLILSNEDPESDEANRGEIKVIDNNNRLVPWNQEKKAFLIPHDASSLTISSTDTKYVSIFDQGFRATLPQAKEHGISIAKEFLESDLSQAKKFIVGKDYIVRLNVRSLINVVPQGVITDLLPAGFEIVSGSLGVNNETFRPNFFQFRDDRATFFGPINTNIQQIQYTIRAVSPGTFVIPQAVAESMYAFDTFGISQQGSDTVTIEE